MQHGMAIRANRHQFVHRNIMHRPHAGHRFQMVDVDEALADRTVALLEVELAHYTFTTVLFDTGSTKLRIPLGTTQSIEDLASFTKDDLASKRTSASTNPFADDSPVLGLVFSVFAELRLIPSRVDCVRKSFPRHHGSFDSFPGLGERIQPREQEVKCWFSLPLNLDFGINFGSPRGRRRTQGLSWSSCCPASAPNE